MTPSLHWLRNLLPKTMAADRAGFRREWERLERELPRLSETERDDSARSVPPGPTERIERVARSGRSTDPERSAKTASATDSHGCRVPKKSNGAPTPGPVDVSRTRLFEKNLAALAERMERSVERGRKRRERLPELHYDEELPICQRREEIARLIRENQVVVVCGETGSGKSTQLPKICLDLGRGVLGMIGHTQPRRIAARAVARRIAEEIGTPLGDGVGFKVRFADETGERTFVKVMTDGILLAESQHDPFFDHYDTIIIDEAHERSLNIDFLLGMMKRVLARRRDLKLIITSATIDAKRFADHFSFHGKSAPIIEVSGRTYPIDILYRPPEEILLSEEDHDGADSGGNRSNRHRDTDEGELRERAFLQAVDELALRDRGDILVFLPTQRDILEVAKLLKHHSIPGDDAVRRTEILPLYARLSFADQQKIFAKSRWRKIVIATNVAESSLTVPGIRYVIDFGTARVSRYSARSRTQRLPIEPISRASADQRAGRCGRIGPGVCIRLYSETDYNTRDEFTTPEIRRTNLASVILQTIAYRLGAIEKFPFLDPPAKGTILDGYKTLYELGAIDKENRLTEVGRRLSRLPVDPRLARMILAAIDEGVLPEVLVIAAALELQDPRERPLEAAAKADEAHVPFLDENSDFLSYLKIWNFWQGLKEKLSGSQLRKACHQNFLSFNRMREWADIHIQLLRLLRESKLISDRGIGKTADHPFPEGKEAYDAIHRSILTGMLIGIAQRTEKGEYAVAGNNKFGIWPGSGLTRKRFSWLVAAERVETSRRFLRCVARIEPDWIEPLAGHLLTKTTFDPFWLRETGYVHAYERVTLFGITIIPKRRIHFGPDDPAKAREIFIQYALVGGDFDCDLEFFQKNQKTLDDAVKLQAKLRQYDLLKGESARFDFYQTRIPEGVYDKTTLARWHRTLSPAQRERLLFTLNDLCEHPIDATALTRFPDSMITFSGAAIPLDYQFKPGDKDDGLTATLGPEEFGQLRNAKRIGWLVPGLLEQKILHLLKSLPKEIRRPLVPMPETAHALAAELSFGDGDFDEALGRGVSRLAGRLVTPSDFDLSRVPEPLLLNLRIVDRAGKILAEGRDPARIQEELGVEVSRTLTTVTDSKWIRDDVTEWDFGSLPESVVLRRAKMSLTVYPALCDRRFLPGGEFESQRETPNVSEKGKSLALGRNGGRRSSGRPSGRGDSATNDAGSVSLRLFDHLEKASDQTRLGIIRLFAILHRRDLRTQADWLPNADRLRVWSGGIPSFHFTTACAELIARCALESGEDEGGSFPIPRNEGDFNRLIQKGKREIGPAVQEVTRRLPALLESFQEARLCVEKNKSDLFWEAATDSRETFDRLFAPGFFLTVSRRWLWEYPRYLKTIPARYERIKSGGAAADRESSAELAALWDSYREIAARHENAGIVDPELTLYRWMLEEYQVSLFAQRLGTSMKVSSVRLARQRDKITQ